MTGRYDVALSQNSHTSILESLVRALPSLRNHHAPTSDIYAFLRLVAREQARELFNASTPDPKSFLPFGELSFPYHTMGETVDSTNLFDLDELIIFSYYWVNRHRYKTALDLGANLGVHSIIMEKCGFSVRAYEPDPWHFEILQDNLKLNRCRNTQAFNEAISNVAGTLEFARVKGNTTSSHLSGAKPSAYGEIERFPVRVASIQSQIAWADLIKVDVEGHEKEVLLAISHEHWRHADALVEIQNAENATIVFEHLSHLGVNLFSQKSNWRQVRSIEDMPSSYHEGTLFITCKNQMPWTENSL